ncbi:MAG: FtsB family cell division protein [Acidimicrobiales bacterium]
MLRRARIAFVAAVVLAAVILATQFPLGELLHARAAVSSSSGQLAALRRANNALSAQVKSLHQASTIEQIAHDQYGLVRPGQKSVVILPNGHDGGASGSARSGSIPDRLGTAVIPPADLVPSDSLLSPPEVKSAGSSRGGYWGRVLDRLEFWKGVT